MFWNFSLEGKSFKTFGSALVLVFALSLVRLKFCHWSTMKQHRQSALGCCLQNVQKVIHSLCP